ncbi:hypothetical protein LOC68_18880 [Blastopirellula sp. JC732]|uniref:Uncharacterized protein n=1 Tax=Blastopirellula sediminis TaxID=2894196 RepID=A0A9X1MQE1_9BACT|nr:hypothetical protein [Blastopirellula sediminis]MCC9606237.1 hypothetical protein [Blastopirellula sediminis]MCC9630465.1 hypothetical protein [Blastopirellula sediminis]
MAKRNTKKKPTVTHEEIVTHSIRLVDREGNDRIMLHASAEEPGLAGIQIVGSSGFPRLELQVANDGEVGIRITNQENQNVIQIGVNQTGNGFSISTKDGSPVIMMGVNSEQFGPFGPTQGNMVIRDAATNEQTIIPNPNKKQL